MSHVQAIAEGRWNKEPMGWDQRGAVGFGMCVSEEQMAEHGEMAKLCRACTAPPAGRAVEEG